MTPVSRAADASVSPIDCTLVVIAKQPVAGRVKTRLCPPYSPGQAADLAAAAIADTLAAVLATVHRARVLGHRVEPVLVLDGSAGAWLDELLEGPLQMRVIPQRDGGLDRRLAGAFEDAVRGARDTRALLVGMDTPQVTAGLLLGSIEALAAPGTDAVLGLADDGGWWALGLQKPDEGLLLGVPMSTNDTGRAQYARLVAAGLSVGLLDPLLDVDTAADAEVVARQAPRTRFAATLAKLRPGAPAVE